MYLQRIQEGSGSNASTANSRGSGQTTIIKTVCPQEKALDLHHGMLLLDFSLFRHTPVELLRGSTALPLRRRLARTDSTANTGHTPRSAQRFPPRASRITAWNPPGVTRTCPMQERLRCNTESAQHKGPTTRPVSEGSVSTRRNAPSLRCVKRGYWKPSVGPRGLLSGVHKGPRLCPRSSAFR